MLLNVGLPSEGGTLVAELQLTFRALAELKETVAHTSFETVRVVDGRAPDAVRSFAQPDAGWVAAVASGAVLRAELAGRLCVRSFFSLFIRSIFHDIILR